MACHMSPDLTQGTLKREVSKSGLAALSTQRGWHLISHHVTLQSHTLAHRVIVEPLQRLTVADHQTDRRTRRDSKNVFGDVRRENPITGGTNLEEK